MNKLKSQGPVGVATPASDITLNLNKVDCRAVPGIVTDSVDITWFPSDTEFVVNGISSDPANVPLPSQSMYTLKSVPP